MIYNKTVILKDARMCIIRNGTEMDGEGTLYNFILTHEETDNLIQYPDEIKYTMEDEAKLMKAKMESTDMVE
ncbi:MAG: GNAT family N-acetyltransferase, partial [Firmicutes bacterium]|nr:GNAT family N-acetyltransferase [Bacillota bacterium]